MKTAILLTTLSILTIGLVGCSSTADQRQNAGALGTNYDVQMGEGRAPLMQSNAVFPEGQWFLYRNHGITPTTP